MLIENGVDLEAWANRGYYAGANPGSASRTMLLDPADPQNGMDLKKIGPRGISCRNTSRTKTSFYRHL